MATPATTPTATARTDARPGHSSNPEYMIQLDAVRAFAVVLVMLSHYTDINRAGEFGVMGVQIFFVLSGFLITGILLRGRELVDSTGQSAGFTLRQFYIRRFLRIFPAYYVTLAVLAAANIATAREGFWWHFTYLSNFFLARHPEDNYLVNLWTLSVEEQFYLLWPCVVLFTPRRMLAPLLVALFVLAPAYRLAGSILHVNAYAKNCLLFSNTDSLGMGAFLALCWQQGGAYERIGFYVARFGLWIGGPCLALSILVHAHPALRSIAPTAYSRVIFVFFYAWMVDAAARGVQGPIGSLMTARPVLYIGKISYGLYLFHHPMMERLPKLFDALGWVYPTSITGRCILLTTATLTAAILSWRLYEKPLNGLKRYYPYRRRIVGVSAVAATAGQGASD